MNKISRKFWAVLLCLALVTGLAACKPAPDKPGIAAGHTPSGAMGRYVEQEETLPEEILSVVAMAQLPDGSLRLLGDGGGQGVGPYSVYASPDGGRSWVPVDYPWLDDLFGLPLNAAALTADGVYISYLHDLSVFAASESGASVGITDVPYTFAYGDMNGLTAIPFDYTGEQDSALTTTLSVAANGDLIAAGLTGEVRQISTANWRVVNSYQATAAIGFLPGVATYGNTIAINSADKIMLYDMDSGASIGEIATVGSTQGSYLSQKVSTISVPIDGSAHFYTNESGLYRVPMGSGVSERLLDGGLSSLGIQNLNFTHVFSVGNDEYLTLASTPELLYRLFRYTYNPDIPTEPSQVLSVYSLHDNKTIRQAISGYQLANPDVRVHYQVGLPENSGVTSADALRTLSTELLGGKGPDVLVLDDMDVDGYIQKNVLRDMTDVVAGIDMLANITATYREGNKLYALPARFYIPMLLGDGVSEVKNLTDFTAWLDTQYTYDIGIRSEELVERFYAACSHRWFGADGSLDEAVFRSDLEQLGKLAANIRTVGDVQSYGVNAIDTMLWYGGAISANYSVVGGYVDVSLFDASIQNRPTASYLPFPSDGGGVFIPGTVLGINDATPSPDNAAAFVRHVLSTEVQATHLGDGFPVNSTAFDLLSRDPGGDDANGNMLAQLMVPDARTGEVTEVSLSAKWPSAEFMTEFKTMLRGTTVPVKPNAVIRDMIIDETAGYIGGTKSLDDTVRSFKQKMDLYLSE